MPVWPRVDALLVRWDHSCSRFTSNDASTSLSVERMVVVGIVKQPLSPTMHTSSKMSYLNGMNEDGSRAFDDTDVRWLLLHFGSKQIVRVEESRMFGRSLVERRVGQHLWAGPVDSNISFHCWEMPTR